MRFYAHASTLFQWLIELTEYGGSVSTEEIVEFVDKGGNVLVAGSQDIGSPLRDLADEVGFEFDESGKAVIDHVHHADDDHTLVASKGAIDVEVMTGGVPKKPVLFRGVGSVAYRNSRRAWQGKRCSFCFWKGWGGKEGVREDLGERGFGLKERH